MSTSTNSANSEHLELFIDSASRTSGIPENFSITLSQPITKVLYSEVVSAEIPLTYYAVNSTNNVLVWNSGADHMCTITPGTYGTLDFIAELKSKMNAQQSGYTITYSSITFKLTFANASSFTLQYTNTSGTSTIGKVIGMNSTANSSTGTSVTLPNTINLGGTKYILIKSDTLVRPKIIRPYLNTAYDNTLYKVPVTGEPGDIMVEKNLYTNLLKYGVRQTLRNIDFQLYDDAGNILNLNGMNWSITVNLITG